MQRFNETWYPRRSAQNKLFGTYLIDIIQQYRATDFKMSREDLMWLPYEDLAECAVACVDKNLSLTLGRHSDLSNNADVKCVISQPRNNIKFNHNTGKANWMHSYRVTGTKNKIGNLLIIGLNTITRQFEHFMIPEGAYNNATNLVEIVIENYSLPLDVAANFHGEYEKSSTFCKWYRYKVDTFEQMCNIDLT